MLLFRWLFAVKWRSSSAMHHVLIMREAPHGLEYLLTLRGLTVG
jgi:hypothetical protein